MNYRYSRDEKSTEFNRFRIDEKRTQNVVAVNRTYDQAKAMAKKLNNGAGFDGWTPYFFASESPATAGV
jgi:hypothetical protein